MKNLHSTLRNSILRMREVPSGPVFKLLLSSRTNVRRPTYFKYFSRPCWTLHEKQIKVRYQLQPSEILLQTAFKQDTGAPRHTVLLQLGQVHWVCTQSTPRAGDQKFLYWDEFLFLWEKFQYGNLIAFLIQVTLKLIWPCDNQSHDRELPYLHLLTV